MAKMGTSYYFPSYQYSLKDHVFVKTSPVFTMARLRKVGAWHLSAGFGSGLPFLDTDRTRWHVGPPWPQ